MIVKRPSSTRKDASTSKSSDAFYIIAIVGVLVVIGLFFFWHQKNFKEIMRGDANLEDLQSQELSIPDDANNAQILKTDAPSMVDSKISVEPPEVPESVDPVFSLKPTSQVSGDISRDGQNSQTQIRSTDGNPIASPTDNTKNLKPRENIPLNDLCEISANTVLNFYAHLDEQDYIKNFGLQTSSQKHFTVLIQRLMDNPPVVSGEMNDLFTILQNTAHFFRIIGKDNILLIKGILDREKNQFEYVLADFYTLLHIPGCAEKSFSLQAPPKSLYDYAGFFLNTMGGRLYLFRRDSMSRLVVSYYAILLIDHANKNAANEHGIDVVTHIDQLIEEIESTSNTLLLKDAYLDKLFSLKEEYQ